MAGFFTNSDIQKIPQRIGNKLPQCGKCGLSKNCISPKMEPTGTGKRKILFVAEAPGEKEDRQGIQLIGDAGIILRQSLKSIGVDLNDCWKTNAVICHPEKKLEPYMVSCCRPNLLKTIERLKPSVIIILGSTALQSLLYKSWKKDVGPLTRWVGWHIPSTEYNCWLCPTYHPSYIIRMREDPQLIKEFENHLRSAIGLENKKPNPLDIQELKKEIELIESPRKALPRMQDMSTKKGTLAFDYETSGLKPERKEQHIASVSFCLNGEDTFAFPYHRKHKKILTEILISKNLRKVAANIKYEDRWSKAIIGCRVKNWYWDTMLMSHMLDNRKQITSLKFQAFVQFGISDYDSHLQHLLTSKYSNTMNQINKIPIQDLLLYNGLDSLLEYKLMVRQREILKQNQKEIEK